MAANPTGSDPPRQRPLLGSEAVHSGRLSWQQLKRGRWLRLLPDVYVHRDCVISHETLCIATSLVMPAGAAISGASAAYLYGADVLQREEEVEVTVPARARVRPKPGVVLRYADLDLGDVICRHGLRRTTPVRTAFDLARRREPETEAVVAVDALLTRCRLTVEMIRAYADGHSHQRGAARIRQVLALAVPGAESPMESRLRLALVRGGLRAPTLQHEVRDGTGMLIARVDLAYPEHRLGVEYDGGCHWDPAAVKKDLLRQNALRAAGWSLLRFTDDDVRGHPTRLLTQVRSALASADHALIPRAQSGLSNR